MGVYPQVDYGQSGGAWVPASRGPVYQAMERARADPAFARLFAADILFGREESGGHYWTDEQTRKTCRWLYNENTLNASQTWVALLFGPPSTLLDGVWLKVGALCTGSDWGFVAESPLTGDTLRMLEEGHWAFSAMGRNGVLARVPYATDSKPLKTYRGRIECGNSKKIPQRLYYK